MPSRGQSYIDAYARQVSLAQRIEQSNEGILSEEEGYLALQKLISDETRNLNALEETLRIKKDNTDLAMNLLKRKMGDELEEANLAKAGSELPARLKSAKTLDGLGDLSGLELTETQIQKLRSVVGSLPGEPSLREALMTQVGRLQPKEPVSAPKQTPFEAAEMAAMVETLSASGESGWKGGPEGRAFRESLSEGDEANLRDLLNLVARGEPVPADHPAAEIYATASQLGAFRNADARLYNASWAAQRRRVTDLQKRAEMLDPVKLRDGRTREQEMLYREAKIRGLNPDDPTEKFKSSPNYDILKRASEIGPAPAQRNGPAYMAAKKYLDLANATGTGKDINAMLEQITKVTKDPNQAREVVAWALAWDHAQWKASRPAPAPAPKVEETLKAVKEAESEAAKALRETEADIRRKQKVEAFARQETQKKQFRDLMAEEGGVTPSTPGASVLSPDPSEIAAPPPAPAPAPTGSESDFDLRGESKPTPPKTDPTNASYAYLPDGEGGYTIYYKGKRTGYAAPGDRAAQSIDRVLAGKAPLPKPPPRNPPPVKEGVEPQPRSSVDVLATFEEEPIPTPAPAKPPAPAGSRVKTVRDPLTGRLIQVRE